MQITGASLKKTKKTKQALEGDGLEIMGITQEKREWQVRGRFPTPLLTPSLSSSSFPSSSHSPPSSSQQAVSDKSPSSRIILKY